MWVSGAWKNTILHLLSKNNPDYKEVISYKTRPLRPWEVDWIDYHYMILEDFSNDIKNGSFLEYAQVYWWKDYYWTKRNDIVYGLWQWHILMKEIDMQWIQQIAQNDNTLYNESLRIFLDLSEEVMIKRITSRAPISHDDLQRRLQTAINERNLAKRYASIIISAEWTIEEVYNEVYNYIKSFLNNK